MTNIFDEYKNPRKIRISKQDGKTAIKTVSGELIGYMEEIYGGCHKSKPNECICLQDNNNPDPDYSEWVEISELSEKYDFDVYICDENVLVIDYKSFEIQQKVNNYLIQRNQYNHWKNILLN